MNELPYDTLTCPPKSGRSNTLKTKPLLRKPPPYPPYVIETDAAFRRRIERGDTFSFIKRPPTVRHDPRVVRQAMLVAYNRAMRSIKNSVTGVRNVQFGTLQGEFLIMTVEGSVSQKFQEGTKGWKSDVTIRDQTGKCQTFPMYSLARCMNPIRALVRNQSSAITGVEDAGITFIADKTKRVSRIARTPSFLEGANQALRISYQHLMDPQIVNSKGTFVKIEDTKDTVIIERKGRQIIASNKTGWSPILADEPNLISAATRNYEKPSTIFQDMKVTIMNRGLTIKINKIDGREYKEEFLIQL